jgi:hypothetical protein
MLALAKMMDTTQALHDNQAIAELLAEMAALLRAQESTPFRAGAYQHASEQVQRLDRGLREILDAEGMAGLERIPTIGKGIAAAIAEILTTGRWSQLERLRGSADPETLFQSVPGIGPDLARRIHDELNIDTLQALEAAAYDGRLARLRGFGKRRSQAIRAVVSGMLDRVRPHSVAGAPPQPSAVPSVPEILSVDAQYIDKARRGELPTIAPKRLNPSAEAWLPVLHTQLGRWSFTALYSNTARAHDLGKTRDWVVIYYGTDHQDEGQCTVVTQPRGLLAGRRIVRGREAECRAYYTDAPSADDRPAAQAKAGST